MIKHEKINEKVQRRATKLLSCLKNIPNESRLKILNLKTLENRRKTGDLIQMYKLVKGMENTDLINGINYAKTTTGLAGNLRRHDKKLVRELTKKGPHRFNFLTNRVMDIWNGLSIRALNAVSFKSFKTLIDREVFGMDKRKDC
ncbi:hypothetical protein BpHYR1_045970 [Brachionus plicatilis]|uniref:RNA-directed DNA polymerase from mobile element jockey-like n=1 Tax=Brachionus plicatilis TaxID=10195 RepID=A0A3M7T718_BRAPC|nr:hypothetical protein BpHYR1_045970 [Brachionus plicatilis]